jgi:hypothetical protein
MALGSASAHFCPHPQSVLASVPTLSRLSGRAEGGGSSHAPHPRMRYRRPWSPQLHRRPTLLQRGDEGEGDADSHLLLLVVQFAGEDKPGPQLPCQVSSPDPARRPWETCPLGWCYVPRPQCVRDCWCLLVPADSPCPFPLGTLFLNCCYSHDAVSVFPQLTLPASSGFLCAWALLLLPGTLQ